MIKRNKNWLSDGKKEQLMTSCIKCWTSSLRGPASVIMSPDFLWLPLARWRFSLFAEPVVRLRFRYSANHPDTRTGGIKNIPLDFPHFGWLLPERLIGQWSVKQLKKATVTPRLCYWIINRFCVGGLATMAPFFLGQFSWWPCDRTAVAVTSLVTPLVGFQRKSSSSSSSSDQSVIYFFFFIILWNNCIWLD